MNMKMCKIIMIILAVIAAGLYENKINMNIKNEETLNIDNISSFSDSFNADVKEQSIFNKRFSGTLNEMNGMDTIWNFNSDKDCELNIIYILNTKSGKIRLSLIHPDNSVHSLCETKFEGMEDYCINTIKIKRGRNRIKLIGEKSKNASFDITIPKGRFQKINSF